MIVYKSGNLLADTAEALINTVNTKGVMGKGIALAFRQAFPRNYLEYREACQKAQVGIGRLLVIQDTNPVYGAKLIINLPTKTHWIYPSEYSYVEAGLHALRQFIMQYRVTSVALPALGCGNGGLNWQVVKGMVETALGDLSCDIRVYEPN